MRSQLALAATLACLPAVALAAGEDFPSAPATWAGATPPPPQPTPAPAGETAAQDETRAVDTLPPEMVRRPRTPRLVAGPPAISPTLGIAVTAHSVRNRPELATASVDLWLGARFHPFVAKVSPFMAAGAEINFRELPAIDPAVAGGRDPTYVEVVPELRYGVAFLREPLGKYSNTVFPNVELYGIFGWRIANEIAGHGARLGIGVSAPPLMLAWAACELPFPTMIELTMDVGSSRFGEREYAFRFGWHF